MKVKVSIDFTSTPGGRFKKQGPFSGEEFKDKILIKAYKKSIKANEKLVVDLDDCKRAFPPSFLDEAFGKLVDEIGDKDIAGNIEIISFDEPELINDIAEIIQNHLES